MSDLKDYIYQGIRWKISTWDNSIINDIYAISIYISNMDDDPRKPMIILGYNTFEQYKKSIFKASDEAEAKWNYAFWLQNEELIIGDNYGQNPIDNQRITNWTKEKNLYYSDEYEQKNFNKALELGENIIQEFVELCVDVVKQLHKEDVLLDKFGMDIPIIIHELEYYDKIAEQNQRANNEELVKEFVEWINSL